MNKVVAVALAGAALCGLAACSSKDQPNSPSSPPPSAADQQPVPAQPSPTAKPEPISLDVRSATIKGTSAQIVTVNGMTAYRFEADGHEPSRVNCLYDCLVTWPPALTDGSRIKVNGIDESLVSTVKRPDGLVQVTLNGWPLYKFKEDIAAADVKGEGVGGNWSTVTPQGKPVIKKPLESAQ